ncbi:MAG: LPXTG cell wall anchor domain-containing protein [Desulfitobacterium sp.]|nr:LPXTG cell wall anchor domain-containing protein [Desulfitobacterium sp.]
MREFRLLFLMSLFIGLSLGVFLNAASTAKAYPEMSPDGVTCTPCHEEGFGEGDKAPKDNDTPVDNDTPTNQEQPTQGPDNQQQGPIQDQKQEPGGENVVEDTAEEVAEGVNNNIYYIIGLLVIVAIVAALLLRRRK